ncbi:MULTISPECIES: hypothetical protein [unclassified Nonomuraea]|uniref:hypothetical protein n=1 Tax=unclassified Nonomuraea TaxID=2593643 RepID=UPI0035C0CF13
MDDLLETLDTLLVIVLGSGLWLGIIWFCENILGGGDSGGSSGAGGAGGDFGKDDGFDGDGYGCGGGSGD